MFREESTDTCYVVIDDGGHVERRVQRRRRALRDDDIVDPWSPCAKRGRGTVRLTLVEYRILRFLAARPNQAITRSRIAEAISTKGQSVTPESLGRHIHSLRGHLGFFSDYIQSVPYIGYRFKA